MFFFRSDAGDNGGGLGPPPPPFRFGGRGLGGPGGIRARWFILIGALIALFILGTVGKGIWGDFMWFDSLAFGSVYITILRTRVILFAIAALVFGLLFYANLRLARRLSPQEGESVLAPAEMAALERVIGIVLVVLTLIIAVIFASIAAGKWDTVLLFLNGQDFGQTDPAFQKDIGFYVFKLPFLRFLQQWLLGAFIVTLVFSAGYYAFHYSLRRLGWRITPAIKAHLSGLGALVMGIFAYGYWLDIYGLVFSSRGFVFGASFTDLNATRPALLTLFAIALLTALLLLVNIYQRGILLPAVGVGLWIVAGIVALAIYPVTVQRFQVQPNEFEKERVYIQRNLDFTRQAYGLHNVVTNEFASEPFVSAEAIARNTDTIRNVRLWDHRPLRQTYNQLQTLRQQYIFTDVDVDRYVIDGELRQVMLGARELSATIVAQESPGWINGRLKFTHGYGLAMSPVNEFSAEGRPSLFVKDLPVSGELTVPQPQIYYGENTENYVIVNTQEREFDFVSEFETTYTLYEGEGGVRLGGGLMGRLRRLAYAWEFADFNIAISGQITADSRLLYRRNIQERINEVAPFLRLDSDPYLVVLEPTADGTLGRLIWIQDAYTTTDRYPYSQPFVTLTERFNYIRNSVKVVVDAYTGEVTFYIIDPTDPIVRTYAEIFPDLFIPEEKIPESIRVHLRYPEDLFQIQVQLYLSYHIEQQEDFYQKNDLWAIPTEKFIRTDQEVLPYYVIMRMPGESEEEFLLILPVTPAGGRRNAIAWIAGRSDGEHLGDLAVFKFRAGTQIDGPSQVEARVDQDTIISPQFTLLGQEGSEVVRGNLLMIPIEDSILYVEPVYVQATGNPFPELKRVIVANGNRIAMEPTLEEALAAVFREGPSPPEELVTPGADRTPADQAPGDQAPAPSAEVADLAKQAQALFDSAQRKLRAGDFAGYGEDIKEMEKVLRQLVEQTSVQTE